MSPAFRNGAIGFGLAVWLCFSGVMFSNVNAAILTPCQQATARVMSATWPLWAIMPKPILFWSGGGMIGLCHRVRGR